MTSEYQPTQAKAANALGVNRRTLYEWIEKGAPDKTEQGYDITAIRIWRERNSPAQERSEDEDGERERLRDLKLAGEAKKVNAEAEIKEFQARQMTEDVVHLDDVKRFLNLFFSESSRQFLRIPQEMKNGYPQEMRRDLEDDVQARIEMALRSMAGFAQRIVELRDDNA